MSLYAGYFAMGFGLDPSGLVSPWNIGGTYAEDVPSVNLGCRVLEGIIRSFLRTDKEREAWDHYISGAGTPIQLTRDEFESIIFSNVDVNDYLSEDNRECSHDDDSTWSERSINFEGSTRSPWVLAIENYAVNIKTSCECECMRWSAEMNDIYDFDPQYFSTHRSLEAELQTIAVNWADKIAQYGWKSFSYEGSTNGNMGNCED